MKKFLFILLITLSFSFNIAFADNDSTVNNSESYNPYIVDDNKKILIKKFVTKVYDNTKYDKQRLQLENLLYTFENKKNYNNAAIAKETLNELDNQHKLYFENQKFNTTQKISIWFSKNWEEIFAYYKWNPDNWFFWIFADIHGWYEYWTYKTAKYLLNELESSWNTWRFIIPTINPDWLNIASRDNFSKDYYIKGRANASWIDLNRNFCTENFQVYSYVKKNVTLYSGDNCNSEIETKNIVNILASYKFSQVITLHSERARLFIPDNSFYDVWEQSFVSLVNNIFPDYYYSRITEKDAIIKSEIDEWWSKLYTWSMETYIYENYWIPVVLLELQKHWQIDYRIKWIIDLL